MVRRRISIAFDVLPFALTALIGPFAVLARFHNLTSGHLGRILNSELVYEVCAYIWPTWLFHLYDPNNESNILIYITVSVNVLIFVLLGMLAEALIEVPHGTSGTYAVAMAIMWTIAFSGDSLTQMIDAAPAVAVASAIYAIPFVLLHLQRRMRHATISMSANHDRSRG
jgi:hypothetical protein